MKWTTRLILGIVLIFAAARMDMILLAFLGVYLVFTGIHAAAVALAPVFADRPEPPSRKWW